MQNIFNIVLHNLVVLLVALGGRNISHSVFGSSYSRVKQVKFVEDSL